MTKFVARPQGGSTLDGDGFTVSYQIQENLVAGGHKDGETALIVEKKNGHTMLILDGDWREQYAKAAEGGLSSCLKVYEANKAKHRSKWSEDKDYNPTLGEILEIMTAALTRN